MKFTIAYAYSPRENTGSRGAYHVQVLEPLAVGRLRRDIGQALCKPRFWGLDGGRSIDHFQRWGCKGCKAAVKRIGKPFDSLLVTPEAQTQ